MTQGEEDADLLKLSKGSTAESSLRAEEVATEPEATCQIAAITVSVFFMSVTSSQETVISGIRLSSGSRGTLINRRLGREILKVGPPLRVLF